MTGQLNEITWQDDELTRWIGEMRRGRDGINLWRDEMKILSRIWRHSLHPHFPPRGLIRYCTRVLRFRAGSNFAKKNKRLLAVYHLNKLKAMSEIFIRKWVLAIQRSERCFSHGGKKKRYVQSELRTMFHVWEKWYVQSKATGVWVYAKIPAILGACSLQCPRFIICELLRRHSEEKTR